MRYGLENPPRNGEVARSDGGAGSGIAQTLTIESDFNRPLHRQGAVPLPVPGRI
jgi:hypothetical protein